MQKHILIVDDDALMRRSMAFNLEQAGYRASSAANAEDALAVSRRDIPDLILLDIGLPGMDGLDALRHFRQEINAPIIFVTARRRELDEVLGLEMGADDYITKPFEMSVLLARIKAVLRRMDVPAIAIAQMQSITVGDLSLDPLAHTVAIAGQPLELPRREFDLLHVLALHPGQVLSTQDILSEVWGAVIGQPQVVYVHIRWLRQKLESNPDRPERILTVRGVGYKLISQQPG